MNTQLHNYLASTHEVYKTIWGKLTTEFSNSFRLPGPPFLYS